MPTVRDRKYFVVKHGLDAFKAMPNCIWRTDKSREEVPQRFNQVKQGDRWIGFAYTTSDQHERPLSMVTGFYECERESSYRKIPAHGLSVAEGAVAAWLIEGQPFGQQPHEPVGVPPIDDLLGRSSWKNQGIVPISADDFDRIRQYALDHEFDTRRIPLLGREPENEQELLAAVVYGHKELGIEKIFRIRKAFPDLLVKIEGGPDQVHLELEIYSEGFFSHGHDIHVLNRRYIPDGLPVVVLCWSDNKVSVKERVHRVYELRSLIREKRKIAW